MRLDQSLHGHERAVVIDKLVDQTLRHLEVPARVTDTWLAVQETEELLAVEEPEPPMSYRTDVLAILECALRAAKEGDARWLCEGVARFDDSLYFLQQAADYTAEDLAADLVAQVAGWITRTEAPHPDAALRALAKAKAEVSRLVTRALSRSHS